MEIIDKKKHIECLLAEIQVLISRFEPTDTGHLRTAVSVLEERVKELLGSLSYPHF